MRTKGKRLTVKEARYYQHKKVSMGFLIATGWNIGDATMSFIGKICSVRKENQYMFLTITGASGKISNIKEWSTMKQWRKDNERQ